MRNLMIQYLLPVIILSLLLLSCNRQEAKSPPNIILLISDHQSWPAKTPANSISREPICAVDIMAAIANIVDYDLPLDAAEDSWDISSLFFGNKVGIDADQESVREAIVHHSGSGYFAVRKGKWKLIPQLGSSGWTKPNSINSEDTIVKGQLYDMDHDPEEQNNLWLEQPEKVEQLEALLEKYKSEGRSAKLDK